MNIQIKQLDKIRRLHNNLTSLDSEIIKIEKLAIDLANDDCDVTLSLCVKNKTNKLGEAETITKSSYTDLFDELSKSMSGLYREFKDVGNSNNNEVKLKFTESQTLGLIHVALRLKQIEREKIIDKLTKLGIEL